MSGPATAARTPIELSPIHHGRGELDRHPWLARVSSGPDGSAVRSARHSGPSLEPAGYSERRSPRAMAPRSPRGPSLLLSLFEDKGRRPDSLVGMAGEPPLPR